MALELRDGRFQALTPPPHLADNFISRLFNKVAETPGAAKATGSILATIFGASPEILGLFGGQSAQGPTSQGVTTQKPGNNANTLVLALGASALLLTTVYLVSRR